MKVERFVAKYWADLLRRPRVGDAGDGAINSTSPIVSLFHRRVVKRRIARFERRLANLARKQMEDEIPRWRPYICLCVDYHPEGILRQAAEYAKLKVDYVFPFKHTMWVYRDSVRVREGYQHEIKTIFGDTK